MNVRAWSTGIKHYQVQSNAINVTHITRNQYQISIQAGNCCDLMLLVCIDIEMVKRKLFSCEANLKSKEDELAQNKNLAILKAKYTRQQLIAKKLAFKVCQSFLENETISSKNLHLFLGQFSGTGAEYLHQ